MKGTKPEQRWTYMIVVMPSMIVEERKPDHVHEQSKNTHDQQFVHMTKLPSFEQTFDCLPCEFHADKHQKDTVAEAGERVQLAPAVRSFGTCWPLRRYRCTETNDQTHTIEEHVYGVAQ